MVDSFLKRGTTHHTPYHISSIDELIQNLVHVATCPVCAASASITPYEHHPIKFKKLDPDAKIPDKKHENDAGYDLYAVFPVEIPPFEQREVRTGIALEMPDDLWGEVRSKSSFFKEGLVCSHGVIDSGYRGEITVFLFNATREPYLMQRWQKCSQLVFHPRIEARFISVKELTFSDRGEGGFGSTGKLHKDAI